MLGLGNLGLGFGGAGGISVPGYDVILLIGQSNMIGWAGPIDAGLDATNARIKQLKRNVGSGDDKTAMLAADPLQHWVTNANTVGLGLTLAKNYLATVPGSREILLVPSARGSTGFVEGYWAPGEACFEDAVERANAAMALDLTGNRVNRFIMIAWHQGENDSGLSQTRYTQYIDNHFAMLRQKITGATSQTPVIVGDLLQNRSSSEGPRLSQADIPNRIPYSAWSSSVGLDYNPVDTLHMTADSERIFGGRYYDALTVARSNSLSTKTVPSAISDLSVVMGDGQAELSWSTPASPNSTICNYQVQYKTTIAGTWADFNDGVFLQNVAKVGGLTNGTGYDFRVMAVNSVGPGATSNEVSGTPAAVSGNLTGTVASCVVDFSAQLSASYPGTGQYLRNVASGTSWPDAHLGATTGSESSDPAFSGTAGTNTGKFVFTSGDYIRMRQNTVPLARIAREDLGRKVAITFHGKIASGNIALMASAKTFSNNEAGLSFYVATDGKISVSVYTGSGSYGIITSTESLSFGVETMFTFAWDPSARGYRLKIYGGTLLTGTHSSHTNYSDIANIFTIGAQTQGAYGLPTGSELYNFAAFDTYISEAQIDSVHTALHNRII